MYAGALAITRSIAHHAAKYVIFPRTTAKSQRFMMFPGTEEDEIEPPAFEYPHVPSARNIVREHIEMLQRGERKPPAR